MWLTDRQERLIVEAHHIMDSHEEHTPHLRTELWEIAQSNQASLSSNEIALLIGWKLSLECPTLGCTNLLGNYE